MSGLLDELLIPTKHKVFVSYHHGGDQAFYDIFSRTFHDTYDSIYDNSLERALDSEDPNYVMRRIREEYIAGTSCTIALIGQDTAYRKYVDWEIRATLEKKHGLVGVLLPTARFNSLGQAIVPDRLHDNIHSGFALWITWQQLMTSATQLGLYIADAKLRSPSLIDNSRTGRERNG